VAKRGWVKKVVWIFVVLIILTAVAALTWRAWFPSVAKIVLQTRGVQVKSIDWEERNTLKLQQIQHESDAFLARAQEVVVMTPWAWKQAARNYNTNTPALFLKVRGWRVILTTPQTTNTPAFVAQRIRAIIDGLAKSQTNCPHAIFLNGTIQTPRGDFNFGVIEWKNGELSGDLTWPQLNDPADFKLKLVEPTKAQLIVRQRALEVGSKFTADTTPNDARLAGYARWKTNRLDLDLLFPNNSNTPQSGFLESAGINIPARALGLNIVNGIDARFRLAITNGQFNLRLGIPKEPTSDGP
jgi:hypothetical protein